MTGLADLQTLVASFHVVHGQHAGKPYAELYQGKKVVATLLLTSPNSILSWAGKSDLLHPRGLKRHSTSWSKEPHDWNAAVELAVCRFVAYHVQSFSNEATRKFKQ